MLFLSSPATSPPVSLSFWTLLLQLPLLVILLLLLMNLEQRIPLSKVFHRDLVVQV